MTTLALTLPLDRVSPVRVPIRDLALGGTDSVTLQVSIVDRDSPDALPIELTGGIGGPAVSMFVWPDGSRRGYGGWDGWGGCQDYGWGWYGGGVAGPVTTLWTGVGTVVDAATGTFEIRVPAGTMGGWPRRCRWAVFFDAEGGGEAELLAEGHLHVRPMVSRAITPTIMLTDSNPAVLTDPDVNAIFLQGFIDGSGMPPPADVIPPIPPDPGETGVTKTDRSGVIALGGQAQQLMAANPLRRGWSLQNKSIVNMWFDDLGGTADPAANASTYLPPGTYYESEPGGASTAAISIYGDATPAQFVAKEW